MQLAEDLSPNCFITYLEYLFFLNWAFVGNDLKCLLLASARDKGVIYPYTISALSTYTLHC